MAVGMSKFSRILWGEAGKGMGIPVVLVHGGAGNIGDERVCDTIDGVRKAVCRGYDILAKGGTSLDAAQACVEVMEEDPIFNAGRGSVLNSDGDVEMDAIIMEGTNLNFGSVGAVKNILHPVAVARKIMDKTQGGMLVGEGANRFAREEGFSSTPTYDLITDAAIEGLETFMSNPDAANYEFQCAGVGTVGAVVVDCCGRVACATSTGGTTGKPVGRLGDTPIPGCGGYANDCVGAVSATGRGESIMKVCLASRILNLIEQGMPVQQATDEALEYMGNMVGDAAGAIAVSCSGDIGISFITKRMAWAYKKGDGPVCAGVDKPSDIQ
ncbi:hypothetical protein RUM43_007854 [Polyplax serrata]|uniref:Asparaginase n=1 Tax=Polyplax serrata TaxID=468196 RepID=A0AAN8PDW3_POLSC